MPDCTHIPKFVVDVHNPEDYRPIIRRFRNEIHKIMTLDEIKSVRDALKTNLAAIGAFFYTMLPYFEKGTSLGICKVIARELSEPTDEGAPMAVDILEVFIIQFYYDFVAKCTSIVARSEDGNLMHGRTMDWGMNHLQKATFMLECHEYGRHLFSGVSWAGMVGLFTGASATGEFSISINYRGNQQEVDDELKTQLDRLWLGRLFERIQMNNWSLFTKLCITYLIRILDPTTVSCAQLVYETLLHCKTYGEARHRLQTSGILAPVYYTIAGTADASIIARDVNVVAKEQVLGKSTYIMVANKDWWIRNSPNIMQSVNREKLVREYVADKQSLTKKDMTSLLSRVRNSLTLYSAIMTPQNGQIDLVYCK